MKRAVVLSLCVVGAAAAQEPPRPLPPSISGVGSPVVPVAAVAPSAPLLARFEPLTSQPPEAVQAVLAARTAGEWLARRHLPHGRFLPGVNPALKTPLDGDTDYRQAVSAWGLAAAARATGDEKLAAAATQAVLTLMVIEPDAATGSKLGFAAACVLAVHELPTAFPQLVAQAEQRIDFVAKFQQVDGSFPADADEVPGLTLQAMAVRLRANPSAADQVAKGLAFYREAFRKKPTAAQAGTLIPAAAELCERANDATAAAIALELADWLCAAQLGRDARPAWVGGFPSAAGEPGWESAHAARGLATACRLLRAKVGDLQRYEKYRPATAEAVEFVRGLQYTADTAAHFEPQFRGTFLVGGVRTGAADGTLRTDATAVGLLALVRFLESGVAEKR